VRPLASFVLIVAAHMKKKTDLRKAQLKVKTEKVRKLADNALPNDELEGVAGGCQPTQFCRSSEFACQAQ
jgi:hypothetical protein